MLKVVPAMADFKKRRRDTVELLLFEAICPSPGSGTFSAESVFHEFNDGHRNTSAALNSQWCLSLVDIKSESAAELQKERPTRVAVTAFRPA
jgi:hypothetical protein